MDKKSLPASFEGGRVISPNKAIDAGKLPWSKHPEFEGVYMKHLVTSTDTAGAFSCHLVWISPGCTVAEHSHDGQWEFNEILEGTGAIVLAGKVYSCTPGDTCINPPTVPHSVSATGGNSS